MENFTRELKLRKRVKWKLQDQKKNKVTESRYYADDSACRYDTAGVRIHDEGDGLKETSMPARGERERRGGKYTEEPEMCATEERSNGIRASEGGNEKEWDGSNVLRATSQVRDNAFDLTFFFNLFL